MSSVWPHPTHDTHAPLCYPCYLVNIITASIFLVNWHFLHSKTAHKCCVMCQHFKSSVATSNRHINIFVFFKIPLHDKIYRSECKIESLNRIIFVVLLFHQFPWHHELCIDDISQESDQYLLEQVLTKIVVTIVWGDTREQQHDNIIAYFQTLGHLSVLIDWLN